MNSPNGATPIASPNDKPPPVRNGPTQFLPDVQPASWRGWLYLLARSQCMGLNLSRWLYLCFTAVAFAWAVVPLPGGWVISLGWIGLLAALWIAIRLARRTDFVAFEREELVLPPGRSISPADKLPVYVTGTLGVEQKLRTFTTVPGFYRTFATREHALLCRVYERRILGIASWPGDEIGLWYAFFTPDQIAGVELGHMQVGTGNLPALAVTCRPLADATKRRKQPVQSVLYLAFLNQDDAATALADLTVEWRPST